MSRKAVSGRAVLSSFDAENNGVVDSNLILQTDSWKHIDNFVKRNFIYDTLEQLNDPVTPEPKLTPTAKKKSDSSVPDSQSLKESGEETLSKSFEREENRVDDTKTKKNKSQSYAKTQKRVNPKKAIENSTVNTATNCTVKRSTKKKSESVATASRREIESTDSMKTKTKNTAKNKRRTTEPEYYTVIEVVRNKDSGSSFKTSTPERHEKQETSTKCICENVTKINDCIQKSIKQEDKGETNAIARKMINDCTQKCIKKEDNVEENENVRSGGNEKVSKYDEQNGNVATVTARMIINDCTQKSIKKEENVEINGNARSKGRKKVPKHDKQNENVVMVTARKIINDHAQKCVKKEENVENNGNVRSRRNEKVSKYDEQNENGVITAGEVKSEKCQKLLEKENIRLIRIIREIDNEEERAEKAIQELSYHLTNIVKTMDYVQGENKTEKLNNRMLENIRLNKIIQEIRDEEIRAQQTVEEFSHRLANIAKTMRYIQESSSNSNIDVDDSSDFSDGSSYTSSTFSCSSSCSCSCHYSNNSYTSSSYGSNEYSEYTSRSTSESSYSSDNI